MATNRRLQRLESTAQRRQRGIIVFEDISDPHNVEAVFRTCDALGFHRMALIFERVEPFDPKRIGKASSSSANKWLDYDLYTSTAACFDALERDGFETVATVLDTTAESIFEAPLEAPDTAILFGNEHNGLSPEAIERADRRLTIPMAGMVESLNLSVSAALVLYELTRQRTARGLDAYLLPDRQRDALTGSYLRRTWRKQHPERMRRPYRRRNR